MNVELEGILEHVGEQAKQIALLRGAQLAMQKLNESLVKELEELKAKRDTPEQPPV